jgi:uncharacterized protein (TIGR02646 family)
MMPLVTRGPSDAKGLKSRLKSWREKADRREVKTVWKEFRSSADGKSAIKDLSAVYGPRCVYCDHAPGLTIDHVRAKAKQAAVAFSWSNWLPSCGDCNRNKGTKSTVQPLRDDPRRFFRFDVASGEPDVVALGKRAAEKARVSVIAFHLDNQTFNDARRAALLVFLEDAGKYLCGGSADLVTRHLLRSTPHRAVVREMLLEENEALNPYRPMAKALILRLPRLSDWARDPKSFD